MNVRYSIFITACLVVCLYACKKDNTTIGADTPLSGKWQETKILIRQTNSIGGAFADTTFTGNSITNADYLEFTGNNTFTYSRSGTFSLTGKTIVINGGDILASLSHYKFNVTDTALIVEQTDVIPLPLGVPEPNSIGATGFIKSIDSKHLIFHTSITNEFVILITDAYFTKEN